MLKPQTKRLLNIEYKNKGLTGKHRNLSQNLHLRKECICSTFSNPGQHGLSQQHPATTNQREGRAVDSLANRRRLHENQQPMRTQNFGRTI